MAYIYIAPISGGWSTLPLWRATLVQLAQLVVPADGPELRVTSEVICSRMTDVTKAGGYYY